MRPVRTTTFVAAIASLAAGGVHLATGGPHLQESVPLGVAFIVAGWLQLLLAAAVWSRPSRATAVAAMAVHVASIGAWAVSRSVGLPFGHPGGAPFGLGGLSAVALEVLAIAALAVFLRDPARVRRLPTSVALAAVLLVLGGASVAVANVATGHGGSAGDEATDAHHDGAQDASRTGSSSSDAHADSGDEHGDADATDGDNTAGDTTDGDKTAGSTSTGGNSTEGDHGVADHDDDHGH